MAGPVMLVMTSNEVDERERVYGLHLYSTSSVRPSSEIHSRPTRFQCRRWFSHNPSYVNTNTLSPLLYPFSIPFLSGAQPSREVSCLYRPRSH